MTNEHNRYLGLCLPYALGRLNPRNRHFFESHLKAGCAECNKELDEIYEGMSLLPLLLPPKQAPQRLRSRVLGALGTSVRPGRTVEQRTQPQMQTQPRPWFGYAVAFVAVLIVVALGIYGSSLIGRLDSQSQQISSQEQQIVALNSELQQKEELLKVLQSPKIDIVFMNGLAPSPAGYGKIIWDPLTRIAIFQVANLPASAADKDYQLWIIKDKIPISAGVFSVNSDKEKENYFKVLSLEVGDKKEIDAFAVTLEPKGGLPQPSGAMYLMGNSSTN
jgi:anti-sigma-K factor RskA